jgi:hypothetical protein
MDKYSEVSILSKGISLHENIKVIGKIIFLT